MSSGNGVHSLVSYPEYKASNTKWFEAVPAHWDLAPLFSVVKPKSLTGFEDRELLSVYLNRGVIKFSDVDEKRTNATSTDLSKYQAVDPGDFVLNNQQAWRGSVGVSMLTGIVSPAYLVLPLGPRLDPTFANYLLRDKSMVCQYLVCSKGVGSIQRNLYWPQLKRITVPLPPMDEQIKAARFIKQEIAKSNQFVRAKRRLIALLREQKQAIVNQAVTRGIDPNVPLKPSGIPWLGDIPAHWETRRLKYIFQELDERTDSGKEVLFSMRLQAGLVPHTSVSEKPITPEQLVGYKRVRPGQMVMNRMRAALGMFNEVPDTGLVSPDYATFKPISDVRIAYYVQLFKTENVKREFRIESKGLGTGEAGFLRLYTDRFGRIEVPVPPLAEQDDILAWIDNDCADIHAAITRAEREIVLMNEYRTRLIADVVTGKVDVRHIEIDDLPDVPIGDESPDSEDPDSPDLDEELAHAGEE